MDSLVNPSAEISQLSTLPPHPQRKGEGGLRTKGIYKHSSEMNPLITVITIVFNGCNQIEQTLRSVLDQTYGNVEYIVIDGGSTDGTVDVIRNYAERIDYWISEPDEGISDAFNKGLQLSAGHWINMLNAGDRYAHDSILAKVAAYTGKTSIVTSFVKYGEGTIPGEVPSNGDRLYRKAHLAHQGSFVERGIFQEVGGFDLAYSIRMDYDHWLRTLKTREFVFVDDIFVIYDAGISNSDLKTYYFEEIMANRAHLKHHMFRNMVVFMKYAIKRYVLFWRYAAARRQGMPSE